MNQILHFTSKFQNFKFYYVYACVGVCLFMLAKIFANLMKLGILIPRCKLTKTRGEKRWIEIPATEIDRLD